MRLGHRLATLSGVAVLALALFACKPDYPKCETDEHCADHNRSKVLPTVTQGTYPIMRKRAPSAIVARTTR